MKKANKKGFTIVELVIVIAVVAILAAVLVPTFVSVVKKANESKDTQLVRNLNTALAVDTEVGKHETMQSALEAAAKAGYDVAKINASATDNEILWDSKNDCFVYKKDSGIEYIPNSKTEEATDGDFWKIVADASAAAANKNYNSYVMGAAELGDMTVANGLDVGENTVKGTITFKSDETKTVTIRTNGGTLAVNAPNATVNHYGKADKITITAVAPHSYHEYGEVVGDIEIVKGRLEVAATATVGTVLVSSVEQNDVKIEIVSGANVGTVAPTTNNAKADIDASTTIPAESKFEDIVTVNNDFAGGLGTEKSPYLIANGTHFANINNLANDMSKGNQVYFKQIKDITVTQNYNGNYFAGGYDGSNYSITVKLPDGNYTSLFATYRTSGHVVFKNMNIIMSNVGVSLLLGADWGTAYGGTFDNITFNSTEKLVDVNCTNFGFVFIEALYTKGEEQPVYTFSNITNNVNLQNAGTCTGFIVGSGPCFNTKTVVNYVNCVNNATISGTSSVGFLYGNSAYIESVDETNSIINVADCKNNGIIKSPYEGIVNFAPKYNKLNDEYQDKVGGSFLKDNYLKDKTISIKQDNNKFTIVTDDSSVVYKLAFNVNAIYAIKNKAQWEENDIKSIEDKNVWDVSNGKKFFIDLPIGNPDGKEYIKTIKAYDKKTAQANGINVSEYSNGFAFVVKDNTTYLVFDMSDKVYINSNVSLIVYAYDSNGVILGTKTIK